MVDFALSPGKTALLNVDLQRFFVDSPMLAPGEGLAVVDRVNRIAQACRSAGLLVVHTRSWMRRDGSNLGLVREFVPPYLYEQYTEGSPNVELHDALDVEDGDVILDKPRYGAFTGTDLELILHARGVDSVVITGIATNICCETTAREAAQRDLKVLFVKDATATMDIGDLSAEDIKRATCASLGALFAQIVTVDQTIEMITKSGQLVASQAL